MRTRIAMQLKAIIRNKAKEEGVPPQLVMHDRKVRLALRSLEHGAAA